MRDHFFEIFWPCVRDTWYNSLTLLLSFFFSVWGSCYPVIRIVKLAKKIWKSFIGECWNAVLCLSLVTFFFLFQYALYLAGRDWIQGTLSTKILKTGNSEGSCWLFPDLDFLDALKLSVRKAHTWRVRPRDVPVTLSSAGDPYFESPWKRKCKIKREKRA